MNNTQLERSVSLLGKNTVDMLLQAHQDALWMLENIGVACSQPDMVRAFQEYESQGLAFVYEGRIYITADLVTQCLEKAPGVDDFFVPRNSFFIGGTAPYLYDDEKKAGGLMPTADHLAEIARIAEQSPPVNGMGRGIKLKDEIEQLEIMHRECSKPIYLSMQTEKGIERAKEIFAARKNLMIVFCLTKPPMAVNENFSRAFVQVVQAGLPVFISAMPMAGISAPYCYNGVISVTQAEALFGICAAQLLNPGAVCINAGFPTIANPMNDYNPDYGSLSHTLLNILQAHLNMILDIPTCQSGCTTNEENPTEKAFQDAKNGYGLCKKYEMHMIRHAFAFLLHLVDFSIYKLKKCIEILPETTADDAPEIAMPEYDERGFKSIQNMGLSMYRDDPLTTANLGKVFNQ
ncbi:MAG: trimethylamine methyltransferase family protein [Desulfosalsimonadaceae bacterium]